MGAAGKLGRRLDKDSINLSLNAPDAVEPKWAEGGAQVGVEYRMNHVGCAAGEDTKKRLYMKLSESGVVMYYCHNCGKSFVTRNKSTYNNYRAEKLYLVEDDSTCEGTSEPGDWERNGFSRMYEKAWRGDPDLAPNGTWGVGTTEKILEKYKVRGWWWESREQSQLNGDHEHFGGCLPDGSNRWDLSDGKEATVLRMYFPVFEPDALGGLRMLSVKQVACPYNAQRGSEVSKIPLPDGQWKWKHFVYNKDSRRLSPIVDNPGHSVCVLVEDRISSLSIQGATNETVTSVCLNGTNIRDEHVFALATNPAYKKFVVWLDNDSDAVVSKALSIANQLRMYGADATWCNSGHDPKEATNDYVRLVLNPTA